MIGRRELLLAALNPGPFASLRREAGRIGRKSWRPMLEYLARMHRSGTHAQQPPLPYAWEEIGPGYHARAFGHWDIVNTSIDVLPVMKQHAEWQIRNNLANQQPDGLVPGVIWMRADRPPTFSKIAGHPPMWPIAVSDFTEQYRTGELVEFCYPHLTKQIQWFESVRAAHPAGFWYARPTWESGLDDDLRQPFSEECTPRRAALDASCAVYGMYDAAARWADQQKRIEDRQHYAEKAARLGAYIREQLYDRKSGFFYDAWSVNATEKRIESHVTIWPLLFGIATQDQAHRLIDEHILNPDRLFARHPIRTIVPGTRGFEMLGWHGPAWNSITYWSARGCLRYGRKDAARKLLEGALEATSAQFARTGTIWEFYDPAGGRPEELRREVTPPYQMPRRDYTGHNPLFAMARLLSKC